MITHHSAALDPVKLEYLNNHHLRRMWSTEDGLSKLAESVHERVKEAFPHRYVTSA